MSARGDWLVYSKGSKSAATSSEVSDAIGSWLARHEVAELALEPLDGYYAIHINDDPKPVPGVFLPASLLQDPEAVNDILEAAYSIWERELAAQ
ncbi:hypothetical protein [Oceanithermus sp.]